MTCAANSTFCMTNSCPARWPSPDDFYPRWPETDIPLLITFSYFRVAWGSPVQERTRAYGLALCSDLWSLRRIVSWVWSDRGYIQAGGEVCLVTNIGTPLQTLMICPSSQGDCYGSLFRRQYIQLFSLVLITDVHLSRPSSWDLP